jgi:hypothetical protein
VSDSFNWSLKKEILKASLDFESYALVNLICYELQHAPTPTKVSPLMK